MSFHFPKVAFLSLYFFYVLAFTLCKLNREEVMAGSFDDSGRAGGERVHVERFFYD